MWWWGFNKVSHGKGFRTAPARTVWFLQEDDFTRLLPLQLDSKPNCSFVLLRGGFSQWIPIDFSGHVIKLYVAWILTSVFSSAPPRFWSCLTFYPTWMGGKLNKDRRWGKAVSQQENWSEHDLKTCSVRHLKVYHFNPLPFFSFLNKRQSFWWWYFFIKHNIGGFWFKPDVNDFSLSFETSFST